MSPGELRALRDLPEGTDTVPGEMVLIAREVTAVVLDPDDPGS
jgi:hypothetical protein